MVCENKTLYNSKSKYVDTIKKSSRGFVKNCTALIMIMSKGL